MKSPTIPTAPLDSTSAVSVVPSAHDQAPGATGKRTQRISLLALAAVLLAWCLPLSTLGRPSLWWDEAWTWFQASQPLAEVIRLSVEIEPHPPLHYLIVHGLMRLGGDSEFVLRFASAAAAPLLAAGGYALGRRFSPAAGVWAAWLLAVAAFPVSYALQARSYALATALTVVVAAAFEWAWRHPQRGRLVLFGAAVLGTFYLHVLAVLPVAGYCAGRLLLERRLPQWLWAVAAGVLLGALPWMVSLIRHTLQPAVPQWRESPSADYLVQQSIAWLVAGPFQGIWPRPVVWLIAAVVVVALVAGLWGRARSLTLPAVIAGFGSALLLGLISLASPIFHERYLGLFAPFVLIGAAGGLAVLRRYALLPGAVLWLAGLAGSLTFVAGAIPTDDLRSVADDLRRQARPGDIIVLNPGWAWLALDYYDDQTFNWAGYLAGPPDGPAADAPEGAIPVVGVGFQDRTPARPNVIYPASDWPVTEVALRDLGGRYERVWLFRLSDTISDPRGRVVSALEDRWTKLWEQTYPGAAGAQLRLYRTPAALDLRPETGFHQVDLPAAGLGRLLGWRWREPPAGSPEQAILQIVWQVEEPVTRDLRTFVHVLDADGRRVGGPDIVTGGPRPLSDRRAGEVILDEAAFPLPDPALSWPVRIGLYDAGTGERLTIGAADQVNLGLTPVRIASTLAGSRARFATGVDLLDADVLADTVPAGAAARVRLTWQIGDDVPDDTTVFLHLVDAAGRPLAQADGPIPSGGLGVSRLPADWIVGEERTLQLPSDLPAGTYQVIGGLYSAATGKRVPVTEPAGTGDWVAIGTVSVVP